MLAFIMNTVAKDWRLIIGIRINLAQLMALQE